MEINKKTPFRLDNYLGYNKSISPIMETLKSTNFQWKNRFSQNSKKKKTKYDDILEILSSLKKKNIRVLDNSSYDKSKEIRK